MKRKRALAFLLAAFMVCDNLPVYAAASDGQGEGLQNQVLNLKFDGDLDDSSGKGNNGSLEGAAYVDGIAGEALAMNGSSYVNLGTSTDLQPQDLTLSFWLNPSEMMTGEQIITWNKKAYNSDGWYLSTQQNAPLILSIGPSSGQPYNVQVQGSRDEFFPAGEWTHVVVTYDHETKAVRMYRNGLACTTTVAYPITGTSTGVLGSDASMEKSIGYNGPNYKGAYLKAAIDEYQLYNDVADAADVVNLYEEFGKVLDKKAIAQSDLDAVSIPGSTTSNLALPTTGISGSDITWTSSDPSVISNDGTVVRPKVGEAAVVVTLTASVSYLGGEKVEKSFSVSVEPEKEKLDSISSLLDDVLLEDSFLVNAADKENDYLLSLSSEKFLYCFYQVAGLTPTTDSGYQGWERNTGNNFRGHTFGHYMSALSQAYLSCSDAATKEELKKELQAAVNGLEKCQDAYAAKYPDHAGYISAFPEGELKKVDGVESATNKGSDNLIVPYYNLHKVLAGLIDISKNVDDTEISGKALKVAEGFGEYLYNRMQKLTNKNKMLSVEYGGMNEALYELYNLTGNDHYKVAAQYFDETDLFKQLQNNQDVLNGKHANTTIPKLTGALKRYTVLTENQEYYEKLTEVEKGELNMYLEAAENFWDIVVEHHTYVTGGNSQAEHFHVADELGYDATKAEYDAALTCETCNTYNMLKLSKALFNVTKDKKYMDYFENTYINAILSSQNPETGTTMYFQPMAPGYNKVFNRPFDEFWCCTGTGMENFSKLGENIYEVDSDGVYVHMFFSSTLKDEAHNLVLKQTADIPTKDTVTFEVSAEDGEVKAGTVLKLRKPGWLADTAVIKVNGTQAELEEVDGYYLVKNVKAGDKITYQMPMKVQVYDMPDNPNLIAFKYGPVVLSTALSANNIEASANNGVSVRVGTFDATAKTTILMEGYDDVEAWKADVEKNLVRIEDSEDGQVQFKLNNTDSEELIYTPHYRRYQERYGLYMYLEGEDSPAAQKRILQEKEVLRDAEMSIDSLFTFDANNYELEKNMQASDNSGLGTYNGKQYRDAKAGGWFSYDLKIDSDAEHNYLNCTFYSGDRSREFDILVNGTKIETYAFADAPASNEFFVHTVEIPKDLIAAAKDGKVTVKFQGTSKNTPVGGLYGITTSAQSEYDTDAELKSLTFDQGELSPAFSPDTTEYTLVIPEDATSVAMDVTPAVGSGLVYAGDILIDDTKTRTIETKGNVTRIRLTSKAQDHETSKVYTVVIRKNAESKVLADFNFDAEAGADGFDGGNAKAVGSYTLQDHKDGKALYLDGTSNFLEVTAKDGSSLLTDVNEMTISFEMKPETSSTNWCFYAAPDAKTQNYQKETYIGILEAKGTLKAERYQNSGSRPAAVQTTVGSEWMHVAVVLTDLDTTIYVNGEEKARVESKYNAADILGENSILYLGKANWGSGEYYKGLIDNFRIEDKALSVREIEKLAKDYMSKPITTPVEEIFEDMEEDNWFRDAVQYVYDQQIMTGMDETHFGPALGMNRAQFATILYRMEGCPQIEYQAAFPDVEENQFYTEAVEWANENGIVTGYQNTGLFDPAKTISREEMAAMLYRFAAYKKYDVKAEADMSAFPDGINVSAYAEDAVKWIVAEGLVTGEQGKLNPQGEVNRATCAVIIQRFMENVAK